MTDETTPPVRVSEHHRGTAAALALIFGLAGTHRYYVGKIGTGVLQLVTLGGLGVWVLVDLVTILAGRFRDKEGRVLREW